jgi:predicted negative regulator of RcsB-dependent stress response
LGKFDEALVEQKKAVELSQAKEKESDGVMYDHLGDIHAALGQKDQAADAWHKAAKAFDKAGEKAKLETVKKKIENK